MTDRITVVTDLTAAAEELAEALRDWTDARARHTNAEVAFNKAVLELKTWASMPRLEALDGDR